MSTGPTPPPIPRIYQIQFKPSAARSLRKLPSDMARRIAARINALTTDPRPSGCESIQGGDPGMVRIRVGDYRVIYQIQDAVLMVLVVKIAHHREVYRDL